MRKKKNLIKRNSGFIIGCVLAAGASFFTADILTSDQTLLQMPSTEGTTESGTKKEVAPEQAESRTFETDPFTVTASGTIVKGVETEAPKKETESETEQQTDENGNPVTPETDENGNPVTSTSEGGAGSSTAETNEYGEIIDVSDGSYDDGTGSYDNGYDDGTGSSGYDDGTGWSDGSYDDGSGWSDDGTGGSGGGYDDGTGGSGGGYDDGTGGSGGGYDDGTGGSGGGETPPVEILDPEPEPQPEPEPDPGAWTPDEVILWGISSRYIDESELYNYDAGQLRLIRNEIFALHGRIFRSQDLQDYFSQRSWYVPSIDPDEFDANMFYYLNDYEEANLNVILNYEAALAGN